MRKQFLLMLILSLSSVMVWAERIDVATARKVAENVATQAGTNTGLRSATGLTLVYAAAPGQSGSALRSGTVADAADYFVFNVPGNKGFVIVSGEDRTYPVLGYSTEGNFDPDNLPDNLRYMLAYYQNQITWVERSGLENTMDTQAEWNRFLNGTNLRGATREVLLETAKWDQGEPYNLMTPLISGKHAVTGCVATAQAIIMRYHKYPSRAVGGVSSYDGISITYDNYDWTNMPLTYSWNGYSDAQGTAVAKLMWHCGANVEMRYGSGGSSATQKLLAKSFVDVFGYSSSVRYLQKEAYRWDEWKSMIQTEVDAGYPVIYGGQSSAGGHSFVCDGYDAQGFFHINWGWSGYHNGFFALSVLDDEYGEDGYSRDQDLIINIRPQQGGEKYIYKPDVTDMLYSGSLPLSNYVSMNLKLCYSGFQDLNYYVELGVVDASGKIIQVASSPKSMFFQAYEPGWRNYTINRSITLNASLKAGERIAVISSPDGKTWEVARCFVTSPTGLDNTGLIKKGDDPNDPTVNPVNVSIYWNQFDDTFMEISGLDNNKSNWQNTNGISYAMTNVTGNIILRYTFKDYAAWKGMLDVYYGDKNSISEPNKGTKANIKTNGSFDVTVNQSQISRDAYINYLKVLSAKAGKLSYDIQVYTESDQSTPVFEEKNKQMFFVDDLEGNIAPNPIAGNISTEIPFTYTIDKADPLLVGKELQLSVSLFAQSMDKIKLYYIDSSNQKKEVELEAASSGTYFYAKNPLVVGNLAVGKSYNFMIKSGRTIAENERASVSVNVNDVGGYTVPSISGYSNLIISESAIITHKVQMNLQHLSVRSGVTSVIDKKSLSLTLLPETGYQLPTSITVTMGGNVLSEGYYYDPLNGNVIINSVTGDIVITAEADPIRVTTYPVKANLKNLSSSPAIMDATTVKEGDSFSITLSASKGYILPSSIIVKMSGAVLESGKGYTYDAKTGKVNILNVKGEIAITAEGLPEPSVYTITANLKNLTSTPAITSATTVKEGESFTFTLKADQNYKLPDAITILKGNDALTAEEFTYDAKTGKVTIKAVYSNLTVKAYGIDNNHYEVMLNLTGVTSDPASFNPVFVNEKVELTLKASEGHTLPDAITVTMGEKTLEAGTDYTYNSYTGAFSLSKIAGRLSITAKGVKNSYSVTTALTNLTSDIQAGTKALYGDAFTCTLLASEGYTFPVSIAITMGGKTLVDATDYTYDAASGKISLLKVTGELTIKAEGIKKSYTISITLSNLTSDIIPNKKIEHGETLTGKLSVIGDYELPSAIEIMMGGKVLVVDSEYSYDPKTGAIEIKNVTANITIKASGRKIFHIEKQTEHVSIAGIETVVKEGDTFDGTLTATEGFKLPYAIRVVMGGRLLSAGSDYTYNQKTGKIQIPSVMADLNISAIGVKNGFFEVILNLTDLTSDPASFEPLQLDGEVKLTFKPMSGFILPNTISVIMGDDALASTDYSYDANTGIFSLQKITETLVIVATGYKEPEPTPTTYTITLPLLEGAILKAESSTIVESGKNFAFTLTLKEGYSAPHLVVKANGTELLPVASGRYLIENVTNNIVVTVDGIVKDNPTGVSDVITQTLKVWRENGKLYIKSPASDTAYIVKFEGRLYKVVDLSIGETVIPMPHGLYIINIGNQSYKLIF